VTRDRKAEGRKQKAASQGNYREQGMTDLYYGVYLIPPPSLVYALSLAHSAYEHEFRAFIAGRFMSHCTIKGFFKLAPGSTPDAFTPALDRLFVDTAPFPVEIKPPWMTSGAPVGESIILWLEKTPEFQQFHNDIWAICKPHVAADCLFTHSEPLGEHFPPHLTLVQADLPAEPAILAQAMALAQYIYEDLPTHSFEAREMQLVEFRSEDWSGKWWESLVHRQLKGWRLGADNR